MDKKYNEIEELIDSSSESFVRYIKNNVDKRLWERIMLLSQSANVYIFSGAIRNFFLKKRGFRDLDFFIDDDDYDIVSLFHDYSVKINSFGGIKVYDDNVKFDIWSLKSTWAFNHEKVFGFVELEKHILRTTFFNFSSIMFDLKNHKFYYTNDFVKFLKTKELDVVYKANPNYKLCVINTFYYKNKYKLKVSCQLKNYIHYLYSKMDDDYTEIQIKHFGKVLFSNKTINKGLDKL